MTCPLWAVSRAALLFVGVIVAWGATSPRHAFASEEIHIGVSTRLASYPWRIAQARGAFAREKSETGATISLKFYEDYEEMLDAYEAGDIHGISATSIDALLVAVRANIDTSILLTTARSHGSDMILVRPDLSVDAIARRPIHLSAQSVSRYLLIRCLAVAGFPDRDIEFGDVKPSALSKAFESGVGDVLVTWEPEATRLIFEASARPICSSATFRDVFIDVLAVRTDVLDNKPKLGAVLVKAWFEIMRVLANVPTTQELELLRNARFDDSSIDVLKSQLETTRFFYGPSGAAGFMRSRAARLSLTKARRLLFNADLFESSVRVMDDIGIATGSGDYVGDPRQVSLRVDPSYVLSAAQR